MPYRLRHYLYTGPLWQDGLPAPALWELLCARDLLLEVRIGAPPYAVTLGVPHHAPTGVDRISFEGGRVSDENAGILGLAALSALTEDTGLAAKGAAPFAARLLVVCSVSDHDPNKESDSPYWLHAFHSAPSRLFLELHGSADHRRHDLELSAGRNLHADPLRLGRLLAPYLDGCSLAAQQAPGSSTALLFQAGREAPARLQNPALKTNILTHAPLPAFHLETRPPFRQAPSPSPQARLLARALALAIPAYLAASAVK